MDKFLTKQCCDLKLYLASKSLKYGENERTSVIKSLQLSVDVLSVEKDKPKAYIWSTADIMSESENW